MQDEQVTEEVGEVDDGIDAMPEETPDQPQVAETPAEPPAPEAGTPFSLEGLEAEQVESWKKDSENRHNWQKTNTQEAQRISEERKALEQRQQQMQQFQQDPVTQALWAARQRIQQNPELLADVERFNASPAQPGQQQPDPLVNQLFAEVQALKQREAQSQWQDEEQARGEAALSATKSVEEFREAHPMSDEEFGKFYNEGYVPSGVTKLEDAYRLYAFDTLLAEARQGAQGEVAAVEDEKAEAAGTVVPGSHTPDVWTGDRNDSDFDGARERSMSRYDLGLSEE